MSQSSRNVGSETLVTTSGGELINDVEVMECRVFDRESGGFEFAAADVRTIADCNLEFLIRFGPGRPSGGILGAATHGVWIFQLGDDEFAEGPPGFWEILLGRQTSTVSLRGLGRRHEDDYCVLREARFRTLDASYRGQTELMLNEGSRLLAQACKDLLVGELRLRTAVAKGQASKRGAPGYLLGLWFSLLLKRNKIRNLYQRFITHRHWGLAIAFSPVEELWQQPRQSRVVFLPSPARNSFHADPFGLEDDNGLSILHEQWSNASMSGGIAGFFIDRATLERFKSAKQPQAAVKMPAESIPVNINYSHHCSYPYLFQYEGENYCIPETSEGARVSLYKQSGGPGEWQYLADIISDIAAVDSTVIRFQGRWWLFCTNLNDSPDSHLYLWHAEDLLGPWREHQNNPVKMDVCSARPAGTPFEYKGSLYRPTQDCSANYGGAISVQRIIELTPERFHEEFCGDLNGLAETIGVDGMHTLSVVGDLTLLDYYRRAFLPGIFLYRLKLYLKARRKR